MMCRIHYDLDTTLEFDIKVKFIVFDMFSCLVHNFFGLTYLTIFGCITMMHCVANIHEPHTTMTFDLKVLFIGFYLVFMSDL